MPVKKYKAPATPAPAPLPVVAKPEPAPEQEVEEVKVAESVIQHAKEVIINAKQKKKNAVVEANNTKGFMDGYEHPFPQPVKTTVFPPNEASFKPAFWFNNN